MTQRMMRLFNTVTEAKEYLKSNNDMNDNTAELYVKNNTAKILDNDKLWVIVP